MVNRYHDNQKLITDPEKLQLTDHSEVVISTEENYDIVVDLKGNTADFERLKPFIAFVAQSLCALDHTAQKFNGLYSRSSRFPYDVKIIFVDPPYVILEYWGTEENTQFDVVFVCDQDRFILKSFGTIHDVPADWEQAAFQKPGQAQKKSLFYRLKNWLSF